MTAEGEAAGSAVRHMTSLLLNVSTLLQEPTGSVRRYEVTNARGTGLSADVSGTLRLLRTDQSILATAALSTVLVDLCGSCLSDMTLPLEVAFDEEFWPPAEAASDEYLQPPQEQIGFSVIDGQLDLSEAVRQYIEMGRPMSPRCGEDCPGLMTKPSSEAPVDDRWSALAALQQELDRDLKPESEQD